MDYQIIELGRNKKTGGHHAIFSCGNPEQYFYAHLYLSFEARQDVVEIREIINPTKFLKSKFLMNSNIGRPLFAAYTPEISREQLIQSIKLFVTTRLLEQNKSFS